jgi:osmotically-inducible protein OsmY
MTVRTNRRWRWATVCLLAGLGVLAGTLPAGAQLQGLSSGSLGTSGSSGNGSSGGGTGGTGGTTGSGATGSISGGNTGTAGPRTGTTGTTGMTGTRPAGTTGTTTQGRTGRAGTVTAGPSTSNPFRSYYVSPLSSGLVITTAGETNPTTAQATSVPAFGQPMYQNTTTMTTTNTTTTSATNQSQAIGFSTVGQDRVPAYVTVVGFDAPPRLPAPAVRADLQTSLSRMPRFQGRDSVQVAMDGPVVVLRGEVNRAEDRRLAEAMVRLTPGVREVRNELQVRNPPPKQP